MNTIAKIKYFVLKQISAVKTKYDNLTNVDMMKVTIGLLIIMFFSMWGYNSILKVRIYNTEQMVIQPLKDQVQS